MNKRPKQGAAKAMELSLKIVKGNGLPDIKAKNLLVMSKVRSKPEWINISFLSKLVKPVPESLLLNSMAKNSFTIKNSKTNVVNLKIQA